MNDIITLRRNLLHGLVFLSCFFGFTASFAQPGRLLLVGGRAEKNGASSWSTPAYRWAGEGKRVAIIGTSTGSLAPYFMQQCGAAWAREFAIASRDSADSQLTYDTLLTYSVIFFRGGDQYEYYDLYRDTKLQDAVEYIYSQGGTICGTSAGMSILSSIVYTAENGSAYPDECIENPNNQYITLAADFMDFVPGFVFDTHFCERSRFGRLVGFLANYSFNQDQAITGLGIDDLTCMTVDENGLGTVYGTGCANIYLSGSNYTQNGNKLLADTVHVIQLLHGCTYDFATNQAGFVSLDLQINTTQLEESGNYTVLASGSNSLANNQAMLSDLVNNTGTPSAEILLFSGDEALATIFKNKLLELGASQVHMVLPDPKSGRDDDLGTLISQATKMLFLKNSFPVFSEFLGTPDGDLLKQKVRTDGMITAFAGEDARLAGKIVVENYLTEYASYYAELTFGEGLSLLKHTVLMPDTYLNSDIYENTATAVPYVMARDTLKYGIWLTDHNYMKFTPVAGKTTLTGYGTAPVMVIANTGNLAGFSSHTATGSTSILPRMVAGFEHLELALIDFTTPYIMGMAQPAGIITYDDGIPVLISPNPVQNELTLMWNYDGYSWEIISLQGSKLKQGKGCNEHERIDVSMLRPGIYIIILKNKQNSEITAKIFLKKLNFHQNEYMTRRKVLFIAAFLILFIVPGNKSWSQGNLVIVGGGLEDNNASVYHQLIALAGGTEKASFAVIPSASGVSVQSYASFRSVLMSYGVKSENIRLINIAMVDDDSTMDVNEAEWSNNGNDPGLAALVRSCSAIWFTGGDQTRTIKTLVRPDGSKTPVLEAVWEVYKSGGVIGGSSAGAAIMSEAMIGGGNSLAALTHGIIKDYSGDDFPEGDGLLMSKGLGFFPLGIVDQHFEQRARIGRLVVALMNEKPAFNLGFGIDENTALIYLGSKNLVKVAGAGRVTLIDVTNASLSYFHGLPAIENLLVSLLEEGDAFDGATGQIFPAEEKKSSQGNEYYNIENPGQAGILSANSTSFSDLATISLMDNKAADRVQNVSFYDQQSGFMVTLSKTPESAGFYTDQPDGEDHYTVTKIRMDIAPVQVTILPLK